jgi:hypothetical protein
VTFTCYRTSGDGDVAIDVFQADAGAGIDVKKFPVSSTSATTVMGSDKSAARVHIAVFIGMSSQGQEPIFLMVGCRPPVNGLNPRTRSLQDASARGASPRLSPSASCCIMPTY